MKEFRPIESRPTSEGYSFLVMTLNNDCWEKVILQVSNFEGNMYADGKQAIIDYEDRITNAVAWMDAPDFNLGGQHQ